ncbi:QacE family quaternary ammonium compound efflux SMR transporter [Streptomyces griseoaurantiacus]|nr:QacE family quaternary ammonium compound efflux SMR transporter [Streptomyces griseoaurantiacus]
MPRAPGAAASPDPRRPGRPGRAPGSRTVARMGMGYVLLGGAIAAEVAATSAMKYSEGFTRLWPSVLTVAGYLVSFVLLAQTLKTVSIGSAYAIWSGVGTAAIAVIGLLVFDEPLTAAKLAGLALIVAGVVVLNTGGAH